MSFGFKKIYCIEEKYNEQLDDIMFHVYIETVFMGMPLDSNLVTLEKTLKEAKQGIENNKRVVDNKILSVHKVE